ncbi:MAG: TRAP transporter substrate-binding protein DctP [Thauera sp.]|jgi:TRAP-type mannitol/chloroaromatic compound transport system substrate-binding protein|nr:TRAP transporter substrate-binding protein DctP [Thauera sp.]
MERRDFLKKASLGAAAGSGMVLAAPAIAQSEPTIKWRLASSFPKTLDVLFGGTEVFCDRLRQLTDGKFDIRAFPAGEIVPGLQVLDAVQAGTVEVCHTAPYYFFGKNEAFAFDCAVPFGMSARAHNAWMYYGGGMEAMREFYAGYGVVNFLAGNSGCQMGGWFRKPIETAADLKGLKMRIGGFAGRVLERLGLVPQQIAAGDIYPALEKGTIDAAEWIGPADDEKLGLNKVAPHYYYPGWWEGSTAFSFLVNRAQWDKLPKTYQAAFEVAAGEANVRIMADYDARNPPALGRLIKGGAKLHAFSRDIMEGSFAAANAVMEETSSKNPDFKKIYEPWKRFRNDQFQWFRVAEQAYAQFTFGKQFSGK